MKTIIAIATTLALLASPGYALDNSNDLAADLIDLYESRGLVATPEVVAKANAIAQNAGPHAGEIWTECDTWFMNCQFSDPAGISGTCQGAVPVHWAAYVWISAPGVVSVGPGIHVTWTESHAGGSLVGSHGSGDLAGTTCFEDFFGYYLTYTTGAGNFA